MFKIPSISLVPLVAVALLGDNAFGQTTNVFCAKGGFREDLQQGVVLTATSNAPARASGRARIVAINDNGTNTSVLFVKTTGLTNGAYFVSLTQLGDTNLTNLISLGSLNVASSTLCFRCGFRFGHWHKFWRHRHGDGRGRSFGDKDEDDDDDDDKGKDDRDDDDDDKGDRDHRDRDKDDGDKDDGDDDDSVSGKFTKWITRCSKMDRAFKHFVCGGGATNGFRTNIHHWFTNCLTVGSGSFLFPPGLVQSNVAQILISDPNGDVVLFGDFSSVTNTTSVYIETVNLVPGTATNLQGTATLTLISRNTRTVGTFKLFATGLEPREKLYLTANGTNTFRVRTSAAGTLRIRTLPRTKLVNLQTLVATDVSSNIVFSASF